MANLLNEPSSVRDCILFATADWDEPYWTNKQHCACTLAEHGWRVLYVESLGLRALKVGSKKDWRRLWHRLLRGIRCLIAGPQLRKNGIWVLSPLVIPAAHKRPLLGYLNRWILRSCLQRFIVRKKFKCPLIWTYHPYMQEVANALPRFCLVYHCVDDLSAIPGIDAAAFNVEEIKLLKKCDAVFTTSEMLNEKCLSHNKNTYFFPNVVDLQHFGLALRKNEAASLDVCNLATPRLVYHGVLSNFKLDLDLLLEVVEMHPEWQLVLIGQESEGQNDERIVRLRRKSNVTFVGYVAYQQLPTYLRGMDVGLLPTLRNSYTDSMFPMKYYEYLAAGLPVASTQLRAFGPDAQGITFGDSAEAFSEAVSAQLGRGRLTEDEVVRMIGDNTWDKRMEKMLAIIGVGLVK